MLNLITVQTSLLCDVVQSVDCYKTKKPSYCWEPAWCFSKRRGGYIMNSTAFVSNTQLVLAKSASVHGTEMAICVLACH